MPDKTRLALRVRTPSDQGWLQISWHPVAARVSVTRTAPTRGSASEAFSLTEMLSTHLQGKVLQAVDMPQVSEDTQEWHLTALSTSQYSQAWTWQNRLSQTGLV